MDISKIEETLKKLKEIDEIKPKKKKAKRLIATCDCETDPFLYGRIPAPFCWGIKISLGKGKYEYHKFWGDDCTQQLNKFLKKYKHPLKIFAHNGGKFDWMFLLYLGLICGEPTLISSRMVEAKICDGRHIIRDSYAMMPVPLAAYKKDNFDYSKNEREVREEYKEDILYYLENDCNYLMELVEQFIEKYGDNLTVGSAALKQLKALHPFEKISEEADEQIRPFYKGGRVQCFEEGTVLGDLKVYDVNSMYPYVMKEKLHPTFEGAIHLKNNLENIIDRNTGELNDEYYGCGYFATVKGKFTSKFGHFPIKTKEGLDFTQKEGTFEVTHHELQCAIKNKVFELEDVLNIIICPNQISFGDYVDKFIAEKIKNKKLGEDALTLFAKLMLNSAYGKFGQDPRKFKDYLIVEEWEIELEIGYRNQELLEKLNIDIDKYNENPDAFIDEIPNGYLWVPYETQDNYVIFERKPDDVSGSFNDCFIAASITGASRAVLMDAIINCQRPIYCDTDSIVCEALSENTKLDPYELGAWDLEAEGNCIYIYGKKVYALFVDENPYVEIKQTPYYEKGVKKFEKTRKEKTANKGVKMTALQIRDLVLGKDFEWHNPAPSMKLSGQVVFIHRKLEAKKFDKIA